MIETVILQNGCFYHVYNRGNNKETLFKEDANYTYFLILIKKYIIPVADVYAYCLLSNHFHLLIRIKDEAKAIERCFSNLFNAYAKAFNKKYDRSGKLFAERFKKKEITDDSYLTSIIYYIHSNPQYHQIISDFRGYRYSSYKAILSNQQTNLKREEVLDWFGGKSLFEKYHEGRHAFLNEELENLC